MIMMMQMMVKTMYLSCRMSFVLWRWTMSFGEGAWMSSYHHSNIPWYTLVLALLDWACRYISFLELLHWFYFGYLILIFMFLSGTRRQSWWRSFSRDGHWDYDCHIILHVVDGKSKRCGQREPCCQSRCRCKESIILRFSFVSSKCQNYVYHYPPVQWPRPLARQNWHSNASH